MMRLPGNQASKRGVALVGAVLVTASIGTTAAVAGSTVLGSTTYHDRVGDAPPRADIRRTTVTATDGAVWASTKVGNLWGVGRYRVFVEENDSDPRRSTLRVIVTKELGKAPVAQMQVWTYGEGAVRVPCNMVVGWDPATDIVKVQLPRRCSWILQDDRVVMRATDLEANGAYDRNVMDRTFW